VDVLPLEVPPVGEGFRTVLHNDAEGPGIAKQAVRVSDEVFANPLHSMKVHVFRSFLAIPRQVLHLSDRVDLKNALFVQ